MSDSEYCIHIKSVQASTIKVLIEALKEILTDTVLIFNENGIKICTMDSSHIILIHLKLEASKFEHFYCESEKLIGINMLNLNKIIKTINNNDTITLYMKKTECNHLGIKIENNDKNTMRISKLNLLDLDNSNIDIPSASFNSVITLPSHDFQKICRDLHNLSEFVELKNIKSQLVFSCKGDFCTQEIVINDSEQMSVDQSNDNLHEIYQGVFNLKYLVMFTKCTNLSSVVELYLKNDYPLIIQYSVGSLGLIKLCLAPQQNDHC